MDETGFTEVAQGDPTGVPPTAPVPVPNPPPESLEVVRKANRVQAEMRKVAELQKAGYNPSQIKNFMFQLSHSSLV